LVLSGLQDHKDQLGLKVQLARRDHEDRKEFKDHKVYKGLLGLLVLVTHIQHRVSYHRAQE
jgi:hypothetical protein